MVNEKQSYLSDLKRLDDFLGMPFTNIMFEGLKKTKEDGIMTTYKVKKQDVPDRFIERIKSLCKSELEEVSREINDLTDGLGELNHNAEYDSFF